jgi:hypothetical protein
MSPPVQRYGKSAKKLNRRESSGVPFRLSPIYPQSRFQLGVARHIVSEINSEFQIRITIFGTANRLTGQRKSLTLEGDERIAKSNELFWLNSKPRRK